MSAPHTPGQTCDACEGHCLQRAPVDAGVELSLRIGQRVRHHDYKGQRVTGVVRGISVDREGALQVDLALDAAIVIPAIGVYQEDRIWNQRIPAHELAAFDDRDELIADLLERAAIALQYLDSILSKNKGSADIVCAADHLRIAIAKAAGSAP